MLRGDGQVVVPHLIARRLVRMAHLAVKRLAFMPCLAVGHLTCASRLTCMPRLAAGHLAHATHLVARRLVACLFHHREDLLGATVHTQLLRILDILPAQNCKIRAVLVKPVEFGGKISDVCMRKDVVLGERVGLR